MQHSLHRASGVAHTILRVGAGFFFFFHGAQKLFGWFGGVGPAGGTVPLFSQFGLAGVLEVVGGPLLIVGLFTRPVALVLAAEMIAAYFIAHFPRGLWPIQNNGEPAVLYGLIFLYLAAAGAGPYSLDAKRRKKVEHEPTRAIDPAEYTPPSMGKPGEWPLRERKEGRRSE